MPLVEPTCSGDIPDDQILTQHGKLGQEFRNTLREFANPPRRERDMSMLLGDMTIKEATDLRFRSERPNYGPFAVRTTTAGALRKAGFRVEHTGSYPGNPYHVSVKSAGEWGATEAAAFDACFEKGGDSK